MNRPETQSTYDTYFLCGDLSQSRPSNMFERVSIQHLKCVVENNTSQIVVDLGCAHGKNRHLQSQIRKPSSKERLSAQLLRHNQIKKQLKQIKV